MKNKIISEHSVYAARMIFEAVSEFLRYGRGDGFFDCLEIIEQECQELEDQIHDMYRDD